MKRRKIISILFFVILIGLIVAIGYTLYLFNLPHRDVQTTKTDFSFEASQIVKEYLTDANVANQKYLDEEGDSKILEISGEVAEISEDFNKQKVVLLKSKTDSAGVSCTFTTQTEKAIEQIKIGEKINIKGVIRSGAAFDKDLNLYEHVIMEKCAVVSK